MSRRKKQGQIDSEILAGVFFMIGFFFWIKYSLSFSYLVAIFFLSFLLGTVVEKAIISMKAKDAQKPQRKKPNKNKNIKAKAHTGKIRDLNTLFLIPFDEMNGHEFEKIVAEYYKSKYKSAIQTPASKDSGVDIIYTDSDGFRVAVQVKHKVQSGKPVDAQEIYKINGARPNHKCNRAEFVSSTGYTTDALQYTDQMRIKTHGSYWVNNDLKKWKDKLAKKNNPA